MTTRRRRAPVARAACAATLLLSLAKEVSSFAGRCLCASSHRCATSQQASRHWTTPPRRRDFSMVLSSTTEPQTNEPQLQSMAQPMDTDPVDFEDVQGRAAVEEAELGGATSVPSSVPVEAPSDGISLDRSSQDDAIAPLAPPQRRKKLVKKFFARDFVNSTWDVGVLWTGRDKVEVTKVFLRDDGSAIWLDGGKGKWKLDRKSRSLGVYREFPFGWAGLRIFSCRLLDNSCEHYLEGDVKGWGPWFALSLMGAWQAIRAGADLTKHGPAPWLAREPKEGEKVAVATRKDIAANGKKDGGDGGDHDAGTNYGGSRAGGGGSSTDGSEDGGAGSGDGGTGSGLD